MSKIHEALRKAQHRQENVIPAASADTSSLYGGCAGVAQSLGELLAKMAPESWQPRHPGVLLFDNTKHAPHLEAFRKLSSQLYLYARTQPLKTVVLTSAIPNEGKTFVVANLGITLARQKDKKVLVIDGDLRRGGLTRLLGARSQPGLAEHLRGKADLSEIVRRGPGGELYLISSGETAENAAELLQGNALQLAMSQLAKFFDWIIVDSPAALPVSDVSALATLADGVLIVARASCTDRDLVKQLKEMFAERVLGVVLNGVRRDDVYSLYEYPGYLTYGSD